MVFVVSGRVLLPLLIGGILLQLEELLLGVFTARFLCRVLIYELIVRIVVFILVFLSF